MKKRKLLIVLSALIFIFACLCSFICSIIKTNEISNKYGLITSIENEYYLTTSGWWVFFAFLPILILFIVEYYSVIWILIQLSVNIWFASSFWMFDTAVNICVHIFVWTYDFISFGLICTNTISGSYRNTNVRLAL